MTITISVSAVDGETHYSLVTPDAKEAKQFLSTHDHEGSSISIVIQDWSEGVYKLLDRVAQ